MGICDHGFCDDYGSFVSNKLERTARRLVTTKPSIESTTSNDTKPSLTRIVSVLGYPCSAFTHVLNGLRRFAQCSITDNTIDAFERNGNASIGVFCCDFATVKFNTIALSKCHHTFVVACYGCDDASSEACVHFVRYVASLRIVAKIVVIEMRRSFVNRNVREDLHKRDNGSLTTIFEQRYGNDESNDSDVESVRTNNYATDCPIVRQRICTEYFATTCILFTVCAETVENNERFWSIALRDIGADRCEQSFVSLQTKLYDKKAAISRVPFKSRSNNTYATKRNEEHIEIDFDANVDNSDKSVDALRKVRNVRCIETNRIPWVKRSTVRPVSQTFEQASDRTNWKQRLKRLLSRLTVCVSQYLGTTSRSRNNRSSSTLFRSLLITEPSLSTSSYSLSSKYYM